MKLLLLCLEIFIARILDVSLGTIKTVFIIKENRIISSLIAFFEVLIWFIVAKEALNTDISSILIPIAYSLGFATGTYIGILISTTFISSNLTVNIISNKINNKDINLLKKNGYGISSISLDNNKKYLIIETKKKNIKYLKRLLNQIDPNAFIFINESKQIINGYLS